MSDSQASKLLNVLQKDANTKETQQLSQNNENLAQEKANTYYAHAKAVSTESALIDLYKKQAESTINQLSKNSMSFSFASRRLDTIKGNVEKALTNLKKLDQSKPEKLNTGSLFSFFTEEDKVYKKVLNLQSQEFSTVEFIKQLKVVASSISFWSGKGYDDVRIHLAKIENLFDLENQSKLPENALQEIRSVDSYSVQSSSTSFSIEGHCILLPFTLIESSCWRTTHTNTYKSTWNYQKLNQLFSQDYQSNQEYFKLINDITIWGNRDAIRYELENLAEKIASLLDTSNANNFNILVDDESKMSFVKMIWTEESLKRADLIKNVEESDNLTEQASKYLENLNIGHDKLTCYIENNFAALSNEKKKSVITKCEKQFDQPSIVDEAILHSLEAAISHSEI